ncbi:hypothetical protein [Egbenema bharatensis]|uniref:hypothetical protein n=1 Tax=Egbenema bharatensis TaxID=3463334 RepID=UPI003A84BC0E
MPFAFSLFDQPIPKSTSRRSHPLQWVSKLGLLLVVITTPISAIAQEFEGEATEPEPLPPPAATVEETGVFFADVLVRGLPVFQVGSLGELSATERGQLINRRIAGILRQTPTPGTVTVQLDEQRNIATLQANNRVIMTVTEQDAFDFNTSLAELAQRWAEELNQALVQPNLAVDVAQRLDAASRQLVRSTLNNLPSLLGALVVIGLTWLVAMLVRRGAELWPRKPRAIAVRKSWWGGWAMAVFGLSVLCWLWEFWGLTLRRSWARWA